MLPPVHEKSAASCIALLSVVACTWAQDNVASVRSDIAIMDWGWERYAIQMHTLRTLGLPFTAMLGRSNSRNRHAQGGARAVGGEAAAPCGQARRGRALWRLPVSLATGPFTPAPHHGSAPNAPVRMLVGDPAMEFVMERARVTGTCTSSVNLYLYVKF